MRSETNIAAIALAIRGAERCDRFLGGEGCDGLEGCYRCLDLAAKAVEEVIR